jgi:hypothetical protein
VHKLTIQIRITYTLVQDLACRFDNTQLSCNSFDSTAKTAKASREIVKEMTSCLFVYAKEILVISSTKLRMALHRSMFVLKETALCKYSPDTQ